MSETVHEMVRELPGRQERKRFMIGKYEIPAGISIPIPNRSEDG